jgi:hypothetical protein
LPRGLGPVAKEAALGPGDSPSAGLAHLICPKCGAEVPDGWPARGCDRCLECGFPLGGRALIAEIVEVGRKVGPILTIGTGLIGAGLVFLVGVLAYGSPLFSALQSQSIPAWALEEVGTAFSLVMAGVIATAMGSRLTRRELLQRGIDSPLARSAAQAFFPRYAVSRLIRSGRLETAEPVVPHPPVAGRSSGSRDTTWTSGLVTSSRAMPLRLPDEGHGARMAGLVVAALVIGLLFLFVIPIPASFNASVPSSPAANERAWENFSSSAQVSGTWKSSNGQPVTFLIINAAGARIFSSLAGSGSFTFVAADSSYAFMAVSAQSATVSVSGTSMGPLL